MNKENENENQISSSEEKKENHTKSVPQTVELKVEPPPAAGIQ